MYKCVLSIFNAHNSCTDRGVKIVEGVDRVEGSVLGVSSVIYIFINKVVY